MEQFRDDIKLMCTLSNRYEFYTISTDAGRYK